MASASSQVDPQEVYLLLCVCVYDAVLLMEFVVSILLSSCFWRVNLSKIGVA